MFVGEMAGAVGTLASQPEKGLETQKRMMEILGLNVPTIAWHVARDNQAEFVSTLAICAGTIGRINHEIFSLQHTEILELEEPFFMGKVGSSTCRTSAIRRCWKTCWLCAAMCAALHPPSSNRW